MCAEELLASTEDSEKADMRIVQAAAEEVGLIATREVGLVQRGGRWVYI